MTMAWVRKTYGVPAKRGMHVRFYDDDGSVRGEGRITSASNYLHVNGCCYHPTWNVVYLADDGSILKDCRRSGGAG